MFEQAPVVVSLFSGAGGLDEGFAQAGFRTGLAYDAMGAAVDSFNYNHGVGVAVQADLTTIGSEGIVSDANRRGVSPVGVIGGPPCQSFSSGNVVTSDFLDARSDLPLWYANCVVRLAETLGIKFFLFENVPGLLRARHSERLVAMRSVLAPHFDILELEVDAYDFGVPQNRRRVVWVGVPRGSGGLFRLATPSIHPGPRTVRDAIGMFPSPTFWMRDGAPNSFHPNHWTMKPKSSRFTTGRFNTWRSFRKIDWDLPSPTVAYGNREIHVHPDGERRLSVYEAMILQGFPSQYRLLGTLSDQVTQVSNAVPPPLGRALGQSLFQILEEMDEANNG